MKLLYITNGITGSGGLERVLSIKASYLAETLNYEVVILTLNEEKLQPFFDFSAKIKHISIAVNGNPITYVYKYVKQIYQSIQEINPDVISVCDDGLKGFFIPIISQKKYPIVYERHVSKLIELGKNPSKLKKFITNCKYFLMNQLGATFDAFIVLTPDNAKEWSLQNLQVIPNPLTFYPEESATLETKKIIAVGKHSLQKGFDRLLPACVQVFKNNTEWVLEIYGKISETEGLSILANKLGIADKVFFFPPNKDIQTKYLESSIYVMSSRFEGFGMVLIEAMACGVPCVTFDCPYGPADIVTNDVDGLVVKNHDVYALSQAINKLVEDENLRKAMGKRAKENVTRYLPETVIPMWHSLFYNLKKQ